MRQILQRPAAAGFVAWLRVVWATQENSLHGRAVRTPLIFADGFESGDTTSRSRTVP